MKPKRIFLKIYLSFWVAVLSSFVIQITWDRLTESRPDWDRMPNPFEETLPIYGQAMLGCHLSGNQAALEEISAQLEKSPGLSILILNQDRQEISSRLIPEKGMDLAVKAIESGTTEVAPPGEQMWTAVPFTGIDGIKYVALCDLSPAFHHGPHPGPPGKPRGMPMHPVFSLLIILLTSGAVCYWLAGYLTSPVISLREMAGRFAGGDLKVRIGSQYGGRKDELSELAADFDRMAERIESLLTLQRQLLGDISHELRSPLARLNVALELARKQTGPEAAKILDRIEQEAESLNQMIGQVLMLTRLEGGFDKIQLTHVNLMELVQGIAEDGNFEAKGSDRSVVLKGSAECTVHGNAELLRRAIENVVRNAIRYTDEQTEVEIDISRVEEQSMASAVVTVRDHGPGVPEAELSNLFRPFYRVSVARDRQTGGTGLGLAITERSVCLHGGKIRALNAKGGGLIVEMKLPLENVECI
ncbi:MAG: ATP-binding protein [Candidatus Wallbacteria bacterium]|nr:ATP-binding protein [Candidatus Wallbacteria bacterium]